MQTVLIVDDNPGFRRQIRALLEADGFSVVAESVDGQSALATARSVKPDVVLLDIGLPDIEGLEVARQLTNDDHAYRVVLTSSRDAGAYGPRLRESGALGFIAKDELSGSAIRALTDAQ